MISICQRVEDTVRQREKRERDWKLEKISLTLLASSVKDWRVDLESRVRAVTFCFKGCSLPLELQYKKTFKLAVFSIQKLWHFKSLEVTLSRGFSSCHLCSSKRQLLKIRQKSKLVVEIDWAGLSNALLKISLILDWIILSVKFNSIYH